MQWPASDVDMWAAFFAKEPPPEDQSQYALAQLASLYVNAHRKPNSPAHALTEFLLFRDAWANETQDETEVSFESIAKAFGAVKRVR